MTRVRSAVERLVAHSRLLVGLLCALTTDHCRQGRNENVEIEPKGSVADVKTILGALDSEIAVAARGDLPESGETRWHRYSKRLKFAIECIHVIGRERARAHEAHVSPDHIPQLRQFIQTGASQKGADMRQDSRITRQLEIFLPLFAHGSVGRQHLLKPLLGIPVHRTQLQHLDRPAEATDALLAVERRTRIRHFDGQGQQTDDWTGEQRQRERDCKVDSALQMVVGISRPSTESQTDETIEVTDLEAKRWQLAELIDYEDMAHAQPIQRRRITRQRMIRYDHDLGAAACSPALKCAEQRQ